MTLMVSVLLPTIRPDLFRLRMAEYARLDLPWPCEVLVVSDQPTLDPSPHPLLSLRYIVQPRSGNVSATNLAFQAAEGRYVYATNDECELDPQIFQALVAAGDAKGEDGLLSSAQVPYCSNDYFGVFFANCPFGRRSFFQTLNGADRLFDPRYKCFYADPDLSLRAYEAGQPVVMVAEAKCTHHCVKNAEGHVFNRSVYYAGDRLTFERRWQHLGRMGGDPSSRRKAV